MIFQSTIRTSGSGDNTAKAAATTFILVEQKWDSPTFGLPTAPPGLLSCGTGPARGPRPASSTPATQRVSRHSKRSQASKPMRSLKKTAQWRLLYFGLTVDQIVRFHAYSFIMFHHVSFISQPKGCWQLKSLSLCTQPWLDETDNVVHRDVEIP